jgi:formate-dependent nitrite reductase cytochrome c552 subunit
MKKILLFLGALAIITSCTKEGPQGPAGAQGPKGDNGQDATIHCQECHNSTTTIYQAELAYKNSIHGTGENFSYGNRTGCAGCHTNEGFNYNIDNDVVGEYTGQPFTAPTSISCYTCHSIHKTYTGADLALKTTAPVKLLANPDITIDLGKGNLCANCHQSRSLTGSIDKNPTLTNLNDSIKILSSRFGPHHGPQSALIAGVGKSPAYEIPGNVVYQNGAHTSIEDACIHCHMGTPYGTSGGGHTMLIEYDVHGTRTFNSANCTPCHQTTAFPKLIDDSQASLTKLLDSLKTILVDKKWLVASTGLFNASASKPLKIKAKEVMACYNWAFIMEDKSKGVHNNSYASALLKNSIQAINSK